MTESQVVGDLLVECHRRNRKQAKVESDLLMWSSRLLERRCHLARSACFLLYEKQHILSILLHMTSIKMLVANWRMNFKGKCSIESSIYHFWKNGIGTELWNIYLITIFSYYFLLQSTSGITLQSLTEEERLSMDWQTIQDFSLKTPSKVISITSW